MQAIVCPHAFDDSTSDFLVLDCLTLIELFLAALNGKQQAVIQEAMTLEELCILSQDTAKLLVDVAELEELALSLLELDEVKVFLDLLWSHFAVEPCFLLDRPAEGATL